MSDTEENKKSIFEAPEEGAMSYEGDKEEASKEEEEGYFVDTSSVDVYDHTAEQKAAQGSAEEAGVAPPDLPQDVKIPPSNAGVVVDQIQAIRETVEDKFVESFGGREVEVTDADKDAFVRSALHESECIFTVHIEGVDAEVEVAMPKDFITAIAQAAAINWGEQGYTASESDASWLLSYQQIHAWAQIRAVNGVPTSWAKEFDKAYPTPSEVMEKFENPDNIPEIVNMGAVRWRMMMEALFVAEMKYKICLQNWQNRNFFTGADSA